jgi:hypothetical protein
LLLTAAASTRGNCGHRKIFGIAQRSACMAMLPAVQLGGQIPEDSVARPAIGFFAQLIKAALTLKTPIQLNGLAICAVVGYLVSTNSPDNIPAIACGGAVGPSIMFALLHGHEHRPRVQSLNRRKNGEQPSAAQFRDRRYCL